MALTTLLMFAAGPNSSSSPPIEMALEREEAPMSRISGVVRAMAAATGAGIAHGPYNPTVIAKYVTTLVLVVLLV